MVQLKLPLVKHSIIEKSDLPCRTTLHELLQGDLDFHRLNSTYASHAFHAFPAKFPPQIPAYFIDALTNPGEIVLDPMMGSGTTLLEASLLGRRSIGFDIDPLAALISSTKVSFVDLEQCEKAGFRVALEAERSLNGSNAELVQFLDHRFDPPSREFINYWFTHQTQLELAALIREIEKIPSPAVRLFLVLAFSSIIITKSGGVSRARDLAHTRPHLDPNKIPKNVFSEFRKRLKQNLQGLTYERTQSSFLASRSNAQLLPLPAQCIDLIVTSPPYANNAIDYMRANKFSLVWLRYSIEALGKTRPKYIGGDSLRDYILEKMPPYTANILEQLADKDEKKALAVQRYYSEMQHALAEMYRVLKPEKAAIVVVGTSVLRGVNVETHHCLAEIGTQIGFELVHIGERQLDRNRRMMPARNGGMNKTQIEERMHSEYVLGLYKPKG